MVLAAAAVVGLVVTQAAPPQTVPYSHAPHVAKGIQCVFCHSGAIRNPSAGLPTEAKFCRGPHNLKHTFGRRLRAVGVPLETRKVLLHHTTGDITIHYSPADIKELIDAVEKLSDMRPVTLLKRVMG